MTQLEALHTLESAEWWAKFNRLSILAHRDVGPPPWQPDDLGSTPPLTEEEQKELQALRKEHCGLECLAFPQRKGRWV